MTGIRKNFLINFICLLAFTITLTACKMILVNPIKSSDVKRQHTVYDLDPGSEYRWKISAPGDSGIHNESTTMSFLQK